jgi:flavodoxin
MVTTLFYFSGTGNTLAVAKDLGRELGDTDVTLCPIPKADPKIPDSTDAVGIIFPVYGWGMPAIVRDFVDRLENIKGRYVFAVCTYGGTLFDSLKPTQQRLAKKGVELSAGFGLRMPVNYIQIFTVLSKEKQDKIIA